MFWVIRRIFIIIIDPPEKTNVMFHLVFDQIRLTVSLHWPHPDVQTWSTDTTIKTRNDSLHIKRLQPRQLQKPGGASEHAARPLTGFREVFVVKFAGITHILWSETKSGKKVWQEKNNCVFLWFWFWPREAAAPLTAVSSQLTWELLNYPRKVLSFLNLENVFFM